MAAYDYTPLYGAGDIIPGTTAGILARLGIENPNVPVYQLLGSENKGQPMNAAERMQFAAQPGQSYRLVNKATGEVLGTASTPESISALVEQSNALSQKLGKKANLSFEQSLPEALGGGYSPIFRDQPNILLDTPTKLIAAAMLAATGAGLAQPGGLGGLGATGATSAPAAAGTSAIGASTVAPTVAAAAPSAFEAAPIIVTGTKAASALAPALITSAAAAPSLLASASSPTPTPQTPEPVATAIPETIVTAPQNLLPSAFTTPELLAAATAGGALGAVSPQSAEVTQGMTPEEAQDVTMTGAGGGGLLGKLTAGMGVADYLTAASLLGSGISSLLGGGGGSTTAVPYVSPFGAGPAFGSGRDMRVNPNIADYERYGFGPEASFFAPEYSQLVSGAAGAPVQTTTGPQASTINPKYVPLI